MENPNNYHSYYPQTSRNNMQENHIASIYDRLVSNVGLSNGLASGNNPNHLYNTTFQRNRDRYILYHNTTKVPDYITNLITPNNGENREKLPIGWIPNENPLQIPSRLLYIQNLENFDLEVLTALFKSYGVVRYCQKMGDIVLVRFQTLGMANKAMKYIFDGLKKKGIDIKFGYGAIVLTPRIWIGGLFPNTTTNQVANELEYTENIRNITWSRNFREAEVYILFRHQNDAIAAVNRIRQRGSVFRRLNCPVQVDYTDICSLPFEQKNCQTVRELGDTCMTQIPASIVLEPYSSSIKLHFIDGDPSIAEKLTLKENLELRVGCMCMASGIDFEVTLIQKRSIFLGIFPSNEVEPSNAIVDHLKDRTSVGFGKVTYNNEEFLSVFFPPSYLGTYIITHFFQNFSSNDYRNQSFLAVIVGLF